MTIKAIEEIAEKAIKIQAINACRGLLLFKAIPIRAGIMNSQIAFDNVCVPKTVEK